ncbi:MAG: hypothetical protein U5K72_19940 [Balneolaceae bacterium]|nr:hypothetical protein [Balneolaceae bacterium]
MISKAHVLSFFVMILLYAGVAIWKWTPSSVEYPQNSTSSSLNTDETIEARFWDHYNQATEYRSQQLYREASKEYSKALQLKSNHKDALYYAGSMHLMAREFEKANLKWNRLLQEEPNAPRTNLRLGTLHFCMDPKNQHFDLEKAYLYFSEAWKLNLEETGAPLLLAKIHLLNNDPLPAEELLSDILSVNSTNEEALFLMGFIKWRSGNINDSRQFLSRSKNYLNQDTDKGHLGEGATKSGNAMLLQGRFCDGFEVTFNKLLQDSSESPADEIYSDFKMKILEWRDKFRIPD